MRSLNTCDDRLIRVFLEVIKYFDCTILIGHRGEPAQTIAFQTGFSKLEYPWSKHNKMPSLAVDVAPYPINWNDHRRFYYFAGHVMAIAELNGVKLRWGGDWNRNTQVMDQTFFDLAHYELVD